MSFCWVPCGTGSEPLCLWTTSKQKWLMGERICSRAPLSPQDCWNPGPCCLLPSLPLRVATRAPSDSTSTHLGPDFLRPCHRLSPGNGSPAQLGPSRDSVGMDSLNCKELPWQFSGTLTSVPLGASFVFPLQYQPQF